MNKKLVSAFAVIICMVLIAVAAMTVSATGEEGNNSSYASVSSEQTGTGSSSVQTSSGETVSRDDSSKESSSAGGQTSSDNDTSSEIEPSSESTTSSEVKTSSTGSTSSEKRPINSTGGHGGSTFIEQNVSQIASQNTGTTSSEAELISSEYSEGTDEEIDHFVARATTIANDIYKIIWIPITLAVICVIALVTVNVLFKKKYPKTARSGVSRREKTTSHEAPKRRRH